MLEVSQCQSRSGDGDVIVVVIVTVFIVGICLYYFLICFLFRFIYLLFFSIVLWVGFFLAFVCLIFLLECFFYKVGILVACLLLYFSICEGFVFGGRVASGCWVKFRVKAVFVSSRVLREVFRVFQNVGFTVFGGLLFFLFFVSFAIG